MDNNEFDQRIWDIFNEARRREGRTYGNPSSYAAREPEPPRLNYPDAIDCESFEEGEEEPWWLWRLPEKSASTLRAEAVSRLIRENWKDVYGWDSKHLIRISGISGS